MGTTQTLRGEQSVRAVLLATTHAGALPTTTELNDAGAVELHCQLDSGSWPLMPSTKEFDAGSWCTGGQDVATRGTAVNYEIGDVLFKRMTDDPDTVRAAFSSGSTMYIYFRVGGPGTEDDAFAADDVVYYCPVEVGLVVDKPVREGKQVYSPELTYAGGGDIYTIAA